MKKTRLTALVVVLVSLAQYCFLPCLAMNVPNSTTDQSALLAFKSCITFDHPQHILVTNWSSATSVCDWIGVSCGKRHYRVVALNLPNMGIGGTIPPHIGNLSFLSYFNITSNTFHGHLPSELARLHRLNVVDFGVNNFSGGVPSLFGNLPKLQYLHLANNSFTGSVPPFIGNISTLESLNLRFNFLEGGVPEEIGYLPKLKWLRMQFNQFSGSIPPTIFNISSLELIDFAHNMMSGSLPEDLCVFLPKLEFLRLSQNEFDGRIPTTLGECRELQILSLSYNKFSGFIPKAIGNLTLLQILYLADNNFKGEIPQELGSLHSLEFLAMESANLTGLIPSSIYNSSSLKELYLQRNKLTGNIPRAIGNCTLLSVLHLGENNLTGLIPEEICELPNVRELRLCVNNLMGAIPTSIFNISSLQGMSLTENNLSSNLPSSIGLWLPNLSFLYLPTNKLTGIIPESISNASKLIALDLGNNAFTGSIPKSLGNLRLLEVLHLNGNNLMSGSSSSSSELSFLTSLVNCKDLKKLLINRNPLDGILPTTIGNLSASLEEFKADSCGIKGNIPSEIGNISNLAFLYMQQNDLTGFIPSTIKALGKLQILDLSNNRLQGSIPDDICQLKHMGDLRLNQNELFGLIPECLGNITSLRYLYLNSNKLTFVIPTRLGNLKDILEINLSSNSLNGNLPPQIGSFKVATLIDFSMNQFTGKIPSTIIGLQNLVTLSLAHNKLQGSIPDSFGSMVSLEFLDLSYNDLSDVIPKSLEILPHLSYLNVSFNKLRGQIPNGGPFANFTIQSFMSNVALCGAPKFQVPPCHTSSFHHLREKRMALALYIFLPIASILLATTFVFLFIKCRRRNHTPSNVDLLPTITPPRITYQQLFRATNGFSESNLLGMGSFGSVYKAILEDTTVLAIKVFNLQVKGAFKSFDIECKIMRHIRHRNLTKVISSCSNLDFKALVLEYMPNGSLEKWLYSYNYSLDMLQRLDIMIDVACALKYLHYDYSMPLVHCDLKPSNILLDDDMVAHVSDFGIAKLLDLEESVTHTKTIATFGYIAPEFGLEGLVSTGCDVYSYGILLMETFTRVKPIDEMFFEDMTMKRWIRESLPNAISHVIDADLLKLEEEHLTAVVLQCVSSIMELALSCSAESFEERMNMKDVLSTLKNVKLWYLANCNIEKS
ncbi:probable LRR receptor-like serine/threonine-protein kinase At3g47570 [Camellia sinensis]|uniref:probable LRR receptor-like serine/threonine-protein kinase At3g47570 n=1 Tax=Camellia sinensis TaxID=4442 RepID=UPI0010361537|nr:probable LRR receptor-like serine/threonine-protein kinase At3g47570 [Camellia sinensis]